jgi:hypothetical protein
MRLRRRAATLILLISSGAARFSPTRQGSSGYLMLNRWMLCVSKSQFSRSVQDWGNVAWRLMSNLAVSRMKYFLLTLLHLAVMTAKLWAPVACEPRSRRIFCSSSN